MRMRGRRLARHRLHGPVTARGATGGTEGRAVRWVTRQRKQGRAQATKPRPAIRRSSDEPSVSCHAREPQQGTGEETASRILNEAQYFKIEAVHLYVTCSELERAAHFSFG